MPHVEQVQHQQRIDLQLVDEAPRLIDDPHAIGVAIRADAQVLPAASHVGHGGIDVGWNRLWVDAAEQWVALAVQLDYGGSPTIEQLLDVAVSRAVHALMHDVKAGGPDRGEVDHPCDLRVIGCARVVHRDHVA